MMIVIPVSFIIFLEYEMRVVFFAWMCVCICLLFYVLDTLYDGLPNHVPLNTWEPSRGKLHMHLSWENNDLHEKWIPREVYYCI